MTGRWGEGERSPAPRTCHKAGSKAKHLRQPKWGRALAWGSVHNRDADLRTSRPRRVRPDRWEVAACKAQQKAQQQVSLRLWCAPDVTRAAHMPLTLVYKCWGLYHLS